MDNVMVDDAICSRLRLLARAWRLSEGDAIGRLLDDFEHGNMEPPVNEMVTADAKTGARAIPAQRDPSAIAAIEVPIHLNYDGTRVDAKFDTRSHAVTLEDKRFSHRRFRSPSGAAAAVIRDLNPSVVPNRNGWDTWIVTETGKLLQSIRRS